MHHRIIASAGVTAGVDREPIRDPVSALARYSLIVELLIDGEQSLTALKWPLEAFRVLLTRYLINFAFD
jgi:hypothetical protein